MIEPFLSFKCVKNRLALMGINYLPYKNGGGYFRGPNRAAQHDVAFEAHPICFVADRPSDTPIDYEAIMGWFQTLALTDEEITTFWDIHDHGDTAHTRGESL
jgi:hypothetical protein